MNIIRIYIYINIYIWFIYIYIYIIFVYIYNIIYYIYNIYNIIQFAYCYIYVLYYSILHNCLFQNNLQKLSRMGPLPVSRLSHMLEIAFVPVRGVRTIARIIKTSSWTVQSSILCVAWCLHVLQIRSLARHSRK